MNDDTLTLLFFGLLGLALWAFILAAIISNANETKRRDKIQLQNQKLLSLMAEKLGVDIDEINDALSKQYKL